MASWTELYKVLEAVDYIIYKKKSINYYGKTLPALLRSMSV